MIAAAASPAKRHPGATAKPASGRLDAVDGLRAFAALWVVLFHVRAFSGAHLGPVDILVRSGSTGVSLFLVLSGFCLYIPFAGGGHGRFRTWRFLRRRAQRLLPAYYASLAVLLLVIVLAAGRLGFPHLAAADVTIQAATHASMTHSLFPSTFYALNGAYWSLALEWQLYLGLPLLVVGVRRFGLMRVVVAVFAVNVGYRLGLQLAIDNHALAGNSLMATAVLPNLLPGRWAEFALGMVAAELHRTGRVAAWASRLRFAAIPLVPAALLAVGSPLSHLLFGAVFFLLLCVVLAGHNFVSRIFSWRPLVAIGVMSYSLYLVHQPLVQATAVFLHDRGGSPARVFAEVLLMIPLVVVVAWVLFVTVERRTLRSAGTAKLGPAETLLLAPLRCFRWGRWPGSRTPASPDQERPSRPVALEAHER